MQSRRIILLVVSLSFSFAACGGVKSRIKERERDFDSYPPEVQAQIQNERIDRGFTEEQVYLAKGAPSEKKSVKRGGKTIIVWRYGRSVPSAPPAGQSTNLSSPYGIPSFGPGPSQPTPMFYDRSYFNVEFVDGKVFNWDQEMQNDR